MFTPYTWPTYLPIIFDKPRELHSIVGRLPFLYILVCISHI